VHVFDRVSDGPKPELVRALGATYHAETLPDSGVRGDVIVECTGVTSVVLDAMRCGALDAITCLTGVSTPGTQVPVDIGSLNRQEVLRNDVVFGSVNANRRHYEQAGRALAAADQDWLGRLLSRIVPLAQFEDALTHRPTDVKVVLDLQAG
jgi:threonine dehydrogenase-like Zn-dependent dehydrogenase